ncbi:MAG: hypothetical protein ACM3PU_12450 [Gemmatimonadota bacterium]
MTEARMPMNDEMIESVARAARLTPEQAGAAVAAVLRFLTARLPSALVGELHARLGLPAPVARRDGLPGAD